MIIIREEAKKMAELLRSGHTMLNLACPVCNNPLFRNKDNEILCPICNKRVLVKENDSISFIGSSTLAKEDHPERIEATTKEKKSKIIKKEKPKKEIKKEVKKEKGKK